jgi:hypothetical protein
MNLTSKIIITDYISKVTSTCKPEYKRIILAKSLYSVQFRAHSMNKVEKEQEISQKAIITCRAFWKNVRISGISQKVSLPWLH